MVNTIPIQLFSNLAVRSVNHYFTPKPPAHFSTLPPYFALTFYLCRKEDTKIENMLHTRNQYYFYLTLFGSYDTYMSEG